MQPESGINSDIKLQMSVLNKDDSSQLQTIVSRPPQIQEKNQVQLDLNQSNIRIGDFDYKQRSQAEIKKPFFLNSASNKDITFQKILSSELQFQAKLPQYDTDSILLKQKTRELAQEEINLQKKREKYKQDYNQLQTREEQLEVQKRDLEIAKNKFEAFVAENQQKKRNALQHMEEEFIREENLRNDELRYKRLQLGLELQVRSLENIIIPDLSIYEEFLSHACKVNEQFQSPDLVQLQFERVYLAKKQCEDKLLQIQQEQREQRQEQENKKMDFEKQLLELATKQQQEDQALMQFINQSDFDDIQIQLKKVQASRQSIVYSNIVSGIDNLYNRAIQISKRSKQIKLKPADEERMSIEDRCIAKIKIVQHLIEDLNKFKADVIDKSMSKTQVYSNYNKQRKKQLEVNNELQKTKTHVLTDTMQTATELKTMKTKNLEDIGNITENISVLDNQTDDDNIKPKSVKLPQLDVQ